MSKRKEIVLDDESEKNLDYLSKILDMNQSKVIKWLINAMARAFKEKTEEVKNDREKR